MIKVDPGTNSNNPIHCFMKSLQEAHKTTTIQLVFDNASSDTSTRLSYQHYYGELNDAIATTPSQSQHKSLIPLPPAPVTPKETPRTAHKSARWGTKTSTRNRKEDNVRHISCQRPIRPQPSPPFQLDENAILEPRDFKVTVQPFQTTTRSSFSSKCSMKRSEPQPRPMVDIIDDVIQSCQ